MLAEFVDVISDKIPLWRGGFQIVLARKKSGERLKMLPGVATENYSVMHMAMDI